MKVRKPPVRSDSWDDGLLAHLWEHHLKPASAEDVEGWLAVDNTREVTPLDLARHLLCEGALRYCEANPAELVEARAYLSDAAAAYSLLIPQSGPQVEYYLHGS